MIYQWVVVRYMADAIRDEPINVGIIVRRTDGQEAAVKMLIERVQPEGAQEIFRFFEDSVRRSIKDGTFIDSCGAAIRDSDFLKKSVHRLNGSIQLIPERASIAENIDQLLCDLFQRYVAVS